MLGDEFAGAGVPERDARAVDDDVELGSRVSFAAAVDDVTDADPPIRADDAPVFAGRVGGAGAVDDITDVLRPFGARAAGSAVTDVLGSRFRQGVFEEESAGVVVELDACTSFGDVDGAPTQFAGDLVGHAPNSDEAAGLHPHGPEAFDVQGRAGGFSCGFKEHRRCEGQPWTWWLGNLGCIPRDLRGDPAGKSLMGTFGVVDHVEPVDLLR